MKLRAGQKVYRLTAREQDSRWKVQEEEQGVVVADQIRDGAWAEIQCAFGDILSIEYRVELRAEGEEL